MFPASSRIQFSKDLLTISLLSCLPVWRLSEDYLVLLPASLCWSMPDTLWAFCMVSTFSFLSPSLLVLWMPISCAMVSHLVSHFDRGDFPRTSIIHGWVRIEQFLSLCWRRWFKTGGSCNRCRRTSQFESRPFFSLFEISKLASSCSWAGVDHTSYHRSRLNF